MVSSSDVWDSVSPAATGLGEPTGPLARLLDRFADGDLFAEDEMWHLFSPAASEFSEVAARLEAGWQVLSDDPMWWLVPAAWPSAHRSWLPDSRPRFVLSTAAGGGVEGIEAADPDDDASDDMYAMQLADAAAAGLPPPPPWGRVWLLRSPVDDVAVSQLLTEAAGRATEHAVTRHGDPDRYDAVDVYRELSRRIGA